MPDPALRTVPGGRRDLEGAIALLSYTSQTERRGPGWVKTFGSGAVAYSIKFFQLTFHCFNVVLIALANLQFCSSPQHIEGWVILVF